MDLFDVNTGRLAEMGSRTMVGMRKEDADEIVVFLNHHNEKRRQATAS